MANVNTGDTAWEEKKAKKESDKRLRDGERNCPHAVPLLKARDCSPYQMGVPPRRADRALPSEAAVDGQVNSVPIDSGHEGTPREGEPSPPPEPRRGLGGLTQADPA